MRNFQQQRPLQYLCGWECATAYAKKKEEEKKEKAWKDNKKKLKEGLKTHSDYLKELQIVFNKFIRLRDNGKPCISCGNPNMKKVNASHYYNANNHYNVRFDEDNVHSSCEYCNTYLHGNLIEYRPRLIEKIGEQRFKELEDKARTIRHFTIPELIELKEVYKEKIRILESK